MASYTAIKVTQNKKDFFVTSLNASTLKELAFVLKRDEDPIKGFQRLLNQNRAKEIANYMDDKEGVIPSPLILSAQPNSEMRYDEKTSKLTFKNSKNSFLVLDGQHRLYGMYLAKNDYEIPVIIFNNLKTSDEVNLFIDINTNQKGVPTTLLIDIKNLTGKEDKKEEKQRILFDLMNNDSVLRGLMSPTKSQLGKISKTTFNQATDRLLDTGYFADENINVTFKAVKNYLEAVELVLLNTNSEKAKLTKSMIFRAIFEIFNDVIEKCLKKHENLKVESLVDIINPIGALNYDNYIGSSNSIMNKISSDMKLAMIKSSNSDFGLTNDIF
jgi:DGQHR domain-containing protein